jgi:hypothetical protein
MAGATPQIPGLSLCVAGQHHSQTACCLVVGNFPERLRSRPVGGSDRGSAKDVEASGIDEERQSRNPMFTAT